MTFACKSMGMSLLDPKGETSSIKVMDLGGAKTLEGEILYNYT